MSVDSKEYEKMTTPTYEQLLEMIERGVVKRIRKKPKHKPFKFGFRGGHYLGAPGKDIFLAMPSLANDEFVDIAHRLAGLFPSTPPNNHLHWAACIRYVYGCFEKQGCLRSKHDKRRMIEEDPDWQMPMKFMSHVRYKFRRNRNTYGRVLHYEMLGHRYGDMAIISNNNDYLEDMIKHYEKSQRLAVKCQSLKHTFTPFYWAAHYYFEVGDKESAAKYHMLNLQNMEKHCPDARPGYREKAVTSIKQLRACSSRHDWKKHQKWILKCKNRCVRKSRGAAK